MSALLSESEFAKPWLSQFNACDQPTAVELLDSIVRVSADDFRNRLSDLIRYYAESVDGPVGLYVERELLTSGNDRKPIPLFCEAANPPRRAIGGGPTPFVPDNADVGSEGILAQLVSEFCRRDNVKFLNHPGPDAIRWAPVRALLIITDFVGSGKRAWSYMQAFWAVYSVRSWCSMRLLKFGVVAYSATSKGENKVRHHASHPTIDIVRPCPTIKTAFNIEKKEIVRTLCEKYDPSGKPKRNSVGFDGGGALLAFSHGLPNNAPLILHKHSSSKLHPWVPLFPARVTDGARAEFNDELSAEQIQRRLEALNQHRLACSPLLAQANSLGQRTILVLAALRRGTRTEIAIASRTGLIIPEVREIVRHIKAHAFVNDHLLLTDAGHRELKHYRRHNQRTEVYVPNNTSPYYPGSLRSPREKSS